MKYKLIIGFFFISFIMTSPAFPNGQENSLRPGKKFDNKSNEKDIPEGICNVMDFNAKGDGITDDTPSIQAAINSMAKPGGRVYIPPAKYLIRGSLNIPAGISVIGAADMPQYSDPLMGTIILATGGRDNEEAQALFELGSSSSVSGLTIYYPEQKASDIHPYSWTFHLQGNDNTLENITLINSYNGIKIGPEVNVRHRIRSVYGCVLRRGIFVDGCYDIGRIENVQFHVHWWSTANVGGNSDLVNDYMINNLEAFIFGRTDWEYVTNTFVFPVRIGYHFVETKNGACNGQFSGIGADMSQRCIVVDQLQPMGLLITNGEFVSFVGGNPLEIEISPSCTGQVRFVNCAFWGPAFQNVVSHSKSFLSLSDCYFSSDHYSGAPLIEADGGKLQIRGCSFSGKKPCIAIRKGVISAIITDNNGADGVSVTNEIGAAAILDNNEPAAADLLNNTNGIKFLPARSEKNLTPGVSYKYYEGSFNLTSDISAGKLIRSGKMKNISLDSALVKSSFAFEFSGWLKIPEDGVYRFFTYSDDGSKMFIDGKEIVNNEGSHGPKTEDGIVALAKGLHEFRLLYFQGTEGFILEAGLSGKTIGEMKIPDSYFFTK